MYKLLKTQIAAKQQDNQDLCTQTEKTTTRELFYLAQEAHSLNKYQKASKYYKQYLGYKGKICTRIVGEAYLGLIDCCKALKYNKQIIKYCCELIALSDIYSKPFIVLAKVEMDKKNWQSAIDLFSKAVNLNKTINVLYDRVSERTYIPLEWISICYWYLGDKKSAKDFHEQAKKIKPENCWLMHNDPWHNTTKEIVLDKEKNSNQKDSITIISPSIARAAGLVRLYYSALLLAQNPELLNFIFVVEENDPQRDVYEKFSELPIIYTKKQRTTEKINLAANQATGDILIMAMDDVIFQTKNWDNILRRNLPADGYYIAYTSDGFKNICGFPIISKKMFNFLGYFTYPKITHEYTDAWLAEIGYSVSRLYFIKDIMMYHAHYVGNKQLHNRFSISRIKQRNNDSMVYSRDSNIRKQTIQKLRQLING